MVRKVVDIAAARARRDADMRVECPRCHGRTGMHATRCHGCGLWFEGEAFMFAPSDGEPESRPRARRAFRVLILAMAAVLAVVVATLTIVELTR
jgi:hypothetical protein